MTPTSERVVRASFNRPQWDVFKQVQPNVLLTFVFGRGVGKTHLHRRIWYRLIAEWDGKERPGCPGLRGVRIILLCPTFKNAIDTYARAVLNELTGDWAFLGAKINKSRWLIEFPGGSTIQFFGAENVDSARGMRCDVVSVDEADDIDKAAFEAVAVPWLSEPWSLKIRLVSGTPRRGRMGLLFALYRLGIEMSADGSKEHPNCFSYHATYRDAPKQVSADYVQSVRASMLDALFQREWEASFDSAEGLVYPQFRESFHVRVPPEGQRYDEIIIGADHGYVDPNVFIVVGVVGRGRDAVCWVLEEFYKSGQLESECIADARRLKDRYPQARWYHDPSVPAKIEALRRHASVNIQGADNDIDDGLIAVAERLQIRPSYDNQMAARLYVHPSCKNTIREFGLYRHKRDTKDKDRVLEKVLDGNDHAMDALRYAIFSRFGRPPAVRFER